MKKLISNYQQKEMKNSLLQCDNHQLNFYFKENIKFLNQYKWLYDFQMTELFCHSLFTEQFKQEVNSSNNYISNRLLFV